jgi:hypothetical protein
VDGEREVDVHEGVLGHLPGKETKERKHEMDGIMDDGPKHVMTMMRSEMIKRACADERHRVMEERYNERGGS